MAWIKLVNNETLTVDEDYETVKRLINECNEFVELSSRFTTENGGCGKVTCHSEPIYINKNKIVRFTQ